MYANYRLHLRYSYLPSVVNTAAVSSEKNFKIDYTKIVANASGSIENQSCKKFPESTSSVYLSIFINAQESYTSSDFLLILTG